MSFEFLPERPGDADPIEPLLDRTFGFDRRAKTVYRLREGIPPCPDLCFVAVADDGGLVGSLRFWPIRIETTLAILLGPLAIEPALQGIGIGRGLVRHGLTEAKRQGERICVVVGEPSYYGPYGFTSAAAAGLILPGPVEPHRFQVLELVPGALDGVHGLIGRVETPAARRRGRNLAG